MVGRVAEADWAIVGGGVVGLSLAWGLVARGRRVVVIDGGDGGFRASRGNFGLVWVQGKGAACPAYARWTRASAAAWGDFAAELAEATGIDPGLRQDGGLDIHLSEETLAAKVRLCEGLRAALGDYPFEVLGHNALRREEPAIGPSVAGAVLHPEDGHANPLRLLRALAAGVRARGGTVLTGHAVVAVTPGDGFAVTCADGTMVRAVRVVLAAGLGSAALGPTLGFKARIRPQRGQILITEKLPPLLRRPANTIRQVDEGGVQIGDSKEEVGPDDGVTGPVLSAIAARAVRTFPALERAQVVRAWGALRVMSPDGLPVYQESPAHPGAFLVTCHSGITLSAAHARLLPAWLEGASAPELEIFGEARLS